MLVTYLWIGYSSLSHWWDSGCLCSPRHLLILLHFNSLIRFHPLTASLLRSGLDDTLTGVILMCWGGDGDFSEQHLSLLPFSADQWFSMLFFSNQEKGVIVLYLLAFSALFELCLMCDASKSTVLNWFKWTVWRNCMEIKLNFVSLMYLALQKVTFWCFFFLHWNFFGLYKLLYSS